MTSKLEKGRVWKRTSLNGKHISHARAHPVLLNSIASRAGTLAWEAYAFGMVSSGSWVLKDKRKVKPGKERILEK